MYYRFTEEPVARFFESLRSHHVNRARFEVLVFAFLPQRSVAFIVVNPPGCSSPVYFPQKVVEMGCVVGIIYA